MTGTTRSKSKLNYNDSTEGLTNLKIAKLEKKILRYTQIDHKV